MNWLGKSACRAVMLAAALPASATEVGAPVQFSAAGDLLALEISAIEEASPWFDDGAAGINIRLTEAAGQSLADFTRRSVGQIMTFSVCDVELVSATVQSVIDGGRIAAVTDGLGVATWNAQILSGEIDCNGQPVQ